MHLPANAELFYSLVIDMGEMKLVDLDWLIQKIFPFLNLQSESGSVVSNVRELEDESADSNRNTNT